MSNDLISRSALKETIQALIEYDNAEDFDKGYNIALQGVIEKIDNAPTVNKCNNCDLMFVEQMKIRSTMGYSDTTTLKPIDTSFGVMEQPDDLLHYGDIRTD